MNFMVEFELLLFLTLPLFLFHKIEINIPFGDDPWTDEDEDEGVSDFMG